MRPTFERNGALDRRDRAVFSESGTDRCLVGAPHVRVNPAGQHTNPCLRCSSWAYMCYVNSKHPESTINIYIMQYIYLLYLT